MQSKPSKPSKQSKKKKVQRAPGPLAAALAELTRADALSLLAQSYSDAIVERARAVKSGERWAHELAAELERLELVDGILIALLGDGRPAVEATLEPLRAAMDAELEVEDRERWIGLRRKNVDAGLLKKMIGELRTAAGAKKLTASVAEPGWLRVRAGSRGLAKLDARYRDGELKSVAGTRVKTLYAAPRTGGELALRYRAGEREFRGLDGRGFSLRGLKLDGITAHDADLRGATLRRVSLQQADLRHAQLGDAALQECDLSDAKLRNADLSEAALTGCTLARTYLHGAEMPDISLRACAAEAADLRGTYAPGAEFHECNLDGADLRYADWEHATLSSVSLRGADVRTSSFEGARLSDVELGEADARGSDILRKTKRSDVRVDGLLTGADDEDDEA